MLSLFKLAHTLFIWLPRGIDIKTWLPCPKWPLLHPKVSGLPCVAIKRGKENWTARCLFMSFVHILNQLQFQNPLLFLPSNNCWCLCKDFNATLGVKQRSQMKTKNQNTWQLKEKFAIATKKTPKEDSWWSHYLRK